MSPFGAGSEGGIILFLASIRQARRHGDPVHINAPVQLVNPLGVRNLRGAKTEFPLCRLEDKLTALRHGAGSNDEAVGHYGFALGFAKPARSARGEMKMIAVHTVVAFKTPALQSVRACVLDLQRPVPARRGRIRDPAQNPKGRRRLRLQIPARHKQDQQDKSKL